MVEHRWDVSPAQAREMQLQLRARVRRRNGPELRRIRLVAGADVSIRGGRAIAAIPVLRFDDLQVVDVALAEEPVRFPYVPGLLSFREIPVLLEAYRGLRAQPDLLLVDGQGIAHPRRFGLAAHLGVLLDKPTIGCAKTRYIGVHDEPHETAGHYVDLIDDSTDGGEVIGGVLRTRDRVKPLFVSIGHKVDLQTALDLVLDCGAGFRLPEPTRMAHQAAGGKLNWPAGG